MYSAGEILIGGAGSVDVELQFNPDALVAFGTNFPDMGTILTGSDTGIHFGIAGPDPDSPGSILQRGIGILPRGNSYISGPLVCAPHGGGTAASKFEGSLTAIGDGGFTISFNGGAGHRVYYLAIGEFDNYAVISATKNLGWRARSLIAAHYIDFFNTNAADFYHGASWGAASYPTDDESEWEFISLSALSFPTSASAQGNTDLFYDIGAPYVVGQTGHFIGPFLTIDLDTARPTGTGLETMTIGTGSVTKSSHLVWDGMSEARSMVLGAGETQTNFPLIDGLQALLTMSVSDPTSPSQGSNRGGVAGFGVATEGYQACVLVDADGSRGAYQSNEKGFASFVDGGDLHAGEVEFDGNNAVLIPTDVGASVGSLVGIGFEEEDPQSFFRVIQ